MSPDDSRLESARACFASGDFFAAEARYRELLSEGVATAQLFADLGVICGLSDRLEQQQHYLAQALALSPDSPDLLSNYGIGLRRTGFPREAIEVFHRAIALNPSFPEVWGNLGHALRDLGDLEQAVDAYSKSLEIRPRQLPIWNALGLLQRDRGQLVASREAYRSALAFDPASPESHWGLGLTCLLDGAYLEAWPHFAYRWQRPSSQQPHAHPHVPPWRPPAPGEWPVALTLVSEQGLGDTLQFCRYARHLRELGVHVTLCVQPPLVELVAAGALADVVVSVNAIPPGTPTAWLPLMDLPGLLGVSPDQPLVPSPYLQASPQWLDLWRVVLQSEQRPLVALHWQGNPRTEQLFCRGRSFPLEILAPLFSSSSISLLSLQKGPGSEQLDTCSFRGVFVACQPQLDPVWDFVQIAAVLMQCELVITSDSALAHLAGALGRPTWLLLPFSPDWRWGLQGSSTFWYPSLRLFRQPCPGDWPSVVSDLQHALDHWLMHRST
jgi:Flp pilus assembly protein TadD